MVLRSAAAAPPGSAQAGLPFGGIPHELQEGVDLLLADEPERGESQVEFTQLPGPNESKQLSLTSLLTEYPGMLVAAGALVGDHQRWPPSSDRASSPTPSTTG